MSSLGVALPHALQPAMPPLPSPPDQALQPKHMWLPTTTTHPPIEVSQSPLVQSTSPKVAVAVGGAHSPKYPLSTPPKGAAVVGVGLPVVGSVTMNTPPTLTLPPSPSSPEIRRFAAATAISV